MKPNEFSRTALLIARQAAHQVLDHGSILYDPFAMKILREDEKGVLLEARETMLESQRFFVPPSARMNPTFDIFRRDSAGLKWLGFAETLAEAREKILQDPSCSEYQFVVLDSASGEQTVIEPPERPKSVASSA